MERNPITETRTSTGRQRSRLGFPSEDHESINVLVVDDRGEDLLALRSVLEAPGYVLMTARSGSEALRLLLEHDFAVILVDVVMPGMDGFELTRIIKQRQRSRLTPIVFLTAEGIDLKRLYRAYSMGAIDYLEKPVDPDIVRAKVGVFAELFRKELRIRRQAATLHEGERRERALKLAELSLAAERRYRNLADAIPQIVWTATAEGALDHCNLRFCEYTGMSLERARGHGFFDAIDEADAEDCRRAWRDAVEAGTPFSVECRLRREADGASRYHLCRAIPEFDAEGRITAWLGTFTDFEDLKQAIGARDEFMAIASHELRTPLTALKLGLQGMMRAASAGHPFVTKLEGALRQTDRIERLIDNLLDVSRVATRQFDLEPEAFDLDETAREVVERFSADARRAGLTIDFRPSGDAQGTWDRLRLEQLLTNLLSNALRYRVDGPVRVAVDGDAREVRLSVEGGSPIPDGQLTRIFQRFERAGGARAKGGLGVGLYVTRQIAEAHGGSVRVTSPPESVPVFVVTLPRRAQS